MTLVRAAPRLTLAVVMLLTATAAGAAASALRSVTVAGSVVVRYPTDWAAQLMGDGTVVALAGPNTGGRARRSRSWCPAAKDRWTR